MSAIPGFDAIAFDLDGTLIDTAPDICLALNTVLWEADLRGFDLQTVQAWIGGGPDMLIGHALAAQGMDDAPEELRARLRRNFDATTLETPVAQGGVFEGMDRALAELSKVMPVVVVTNKPSHLARAVLEAAELLPYITAVHGADTIEQRKPAPYLLQEAARQLRLSPKQMIMVGDSPEDVRSARAAGCAVALVDWGYGSAKVDASEPDLWRVRSATHLLNCVLLEAAGR